MSMQFDGYHSRNYSVLSCIVLLVTLILTQNAVAAQGTQNLSCPAFGELHAELVMRKDKLVKLKAGLEAFMTGKTIADIPLSALFMIDLTDANAVAQRVAELRADGSGTKSDPLLGCALSVEGLHAAANEVIGLQRTVSDLRLQFLTLPPDKRAAILRPQIEASAQADTVKQLQVEHSSALEEQKQAAKSLARVEQQALTAESGAVGDLIAGRAELERSRSDLTVLQVKWVSDLEQQVSFYQETSEKLAEIARFMLQPESAAALKTEYEKAVVIWRVLVDKTPKVVSSRYALALPPLPDYPDKLLGKIGDTPEARDYIAAYKDAQVFRESLQDKIGASIQETVDLHYRVLLQSGAIRSQLLNQLLDSGDYSPLTLSADLFKDIRREIAIVPYRWTATFYLRSLVIHKRLSQGWQGLAETASSFALLLALLTIPWLIWVGTQSLNRQLNHLRVMLVRQSRIYPKAIHLALAIQKILPYSTWLVMLLAVYIAQQLLTLTDFSELALLLPYIRYYIYYRLFRQLMQCDFLW